MCPHSITSYLCEKPWHACRRETSVHGGTLIDIPEKADRPFLESPINLPAGYTFIISQTRCVYFYWSSKLKMLISIKWHIWPSTAQRGQLWCYMLSTRGKTVAILEQLDHRDLGCVAPDGRPDSGHLRDVILMAWLGTAMSKVSQLCMSFAHTSLRVRLLYLWLEGDGACTWNVPELMFDDSTLSLKINDHSWIIESRYCSLLFILLGGPSIEDLEISLYSN